MHEHDKYIRVILMEQPVKCPFCKPFADDIVAKNDLCYARWDRYPVNKGHLLLIPFRHTPDFFSLTPEEKQAMLDIVDVCTEVIVENFKPDGYNIGMNMVMAESLNHEKNSSGFSESVR
jgi:diadenosine tetraphosphate (Ap4A) HIT family hydrolase